MIPLVLLTLIIKFPQRRVDETEEGSRSGEHKSGERGGRAQGTGVGQWPVADVGRRARA